VRVMTIGDCHCPAMKRGYLEFLKATADYWQPDHIVMIGDLVDWCCISYHDKDIGLPNAHREVAKARKQVAGIYAEFPDADWLLGNHDVLPNRRAADVGLPADLLRCHAEYWGVDGWRVHARYEYIKIDGVLYGHGERGAQGRMAAIGQATANFRSTVIGHLHANAGVEFAANEEFRVFGMSVGCGVDYKALAMSYGRRYTRKPIWGCGIVEDGVYPYFIPWDKRSR
jgi:hypothetical protein